MASVAADARYPVSAQDRADCIDLVNRLNWAFDEWDLATMMAAFTEDATVEHPRGIVRGREELRRFYEGYFPITQGVRRQAVNHVADGLPDRRIRITSYNQLVRVAAAEDGPAVRERMITEHAGRFPQLAMHSLMVDVCRRDEATGWRICARQALRTVVNHELR